MKIPAETLRLYAVADCAKLNGLALERAVEELLSAGVTALELEADSFSDQEFIDQAKAIRPICHHFHTPLLVRNNLTAALQADADGMRLNWSEERLVEIRERLGPDKYLGSSAHNVQEAILALRQGADFLICGSVFGSSSHSDAVRALERPELWRICKAVNIPVVAGGGINLQNAPLLIATGIVGIAVSRGLFDVPNKAIAAHELRGLSERICAYQPEPPILNFNYRRRSR